MRALEITSAYPLPLAVLLKARAEFYKRLAEYPKSHLVSEYRWRSFADMLGPDIDTEQARSIFREDGPEAMLFYGKPVFWDADCPKTRWYMLDVERATMKDIKGRTYVQRWRRVDRGPGRQVGRGAPYQSRILEFAEQKSSASV